MMLTEEILLRVLAQVGITGDVSELVLQSFREQGVVISDSQRTSLNTTLMLEDSLMGDVGDTIISPREFADCYNDPPEEKYVQQGIIAVGGMGEIHQVFDFSLNRALAMKVIHTSLHSNQSIVMRFIEEAQVVAQLQHPNIVPIHEIGVLEDGRQYFTMKKIEGESFDQRIVDVHRAVRENEWFPTEDGWSLRRLLSTFLEICDAISYAHSKGVIHRDIKPDNIMIGAFGEVLVLDWGIAKILGKEVDEDDSIITERSELNAFQTRMGQVAGTPAYMSPEQAIGRIDLIDERSDIYALGALLYEILSGKPPYSGDSGQDILNQVRTRPPLPLAEIRSIPFDEEIEVEHHREQDFSRHQLQEDQGPPIPIELISVCEKAMSREKDERFQNTVDLAQGIRDWLDGAQKHEQAMSVIAKAQQIGKEAQQLQLQREQLQRELEQETVLGWDSLAKKRKHWNKEDAVMKLEIEQERLEAEEEYLYRAAFTHMPKMVAAHRGLAHLYRKWHQQAERSNNRRDQFRCEQALEHHVRDLPALEQASFLQYLQGTGQLSVYTTQDGASLVLERYHAIDHRLEAIIQESIGELPLQQIPMEMGSYRLRVTASGYAEMLVPFEVSRLSNVHLGTKEKPLSLVSQLGEDECYIPEGYTKVGGDPEAINGLPARRLWIDSFIIKKFPVTNREYLRFLNSLLRDGQREIAWQCSPKKGSHQLYESLYYFCEQKQVFTVSQEEDSVLQGLDWPVCFIDWNCANAYAAWLSKKTGKPWRLPHELEWEKAARGVDGRIYPWGDLFDASFCCMADSQEEALPCDIWDFPADESPYGVRHMAGLVSEWTASAWNPYGPTIENERFIVEEEDPDDDKVIRGGYWEDYPGRLRLACRDDGSVFFRDNYLGFRLVLSL